MKKALAVFVMFTFTTAMAADWENPERKFSTDKNFTNQTLITWQPVDNVQKVCEAESRKRGFGGFGYGVEACSFWESNKCTIITGKNTTMHAIGHEVRHCFQGGFH